MRRIVHPGEIVLSDEDVIKLQKSLIDWGVSGGYDAFDAWYEYYNNKTLPFAGGWLDQPRWIRNSFGFFNKLLNYHYQQKDRPTLQDINLSTPKNMFPFSIKATDNGKRHDSDN